MTKEHEQLAQAAAEYCASPESDELRGALVQCVLNLPLNDKAWNFVAGSGIVSITTVTGDFRDCCLAIDEEAARRINEALRPEITGNLALPTRPC